MGRMGERNHQQKADTQKTDGYQRNQGGPDGVPGSPNGGRKNFNTGKCGISRRQIRHNQCSLKLHLGILGKQPDKGHSSQV